MSGRRKVGIMGGTFDPIHFVHLVLAENAYRAYDLDEVLIMPNSQPPHKQGRHITPGLDRLAMAQLAVKDVPYFRVSDMEIRRKGLSYTARTLYELRQQHPDTDYYFIMGADSVFQIETWHEPARILDSCIVLAAVRDHKRVSQLQEQIDYLHRKYGSDIRILPIPELELSSSQIRCRRREGLSVRFMLPDSVLEYMNSHHLYERES